MKIKLLALLILFFALSTKPLLGAAGASPEQVVDTSGKKLRAGVSYYIVPVSSNGGGLDVTNTSNQCPLYVVTVDGNQGWPLSFSPLNTKKGVIRESTDLNIYFSTMETSCPESTVWKLDDYDYATGQWFVGTGGALGNPGSETISNWFKIEKFEDAYKLVYCPSVCKDCGYQCNDVGIYEDQYGKRLALNYVPYKVQFQQAF